MKRNGRPPLDDASPSARICVSMPQKQLDDLCREAVTKAISVPEVIRQKLRQADGKYIRK
jgi:hypothetical protein